MFIERCIRKNRFNGFLAFMHTRCTDTYHLKQVFADSELQADSVIRNFRITAADGKSYDTQHYNLAAGKVTAEIAQAHAESEFEKYRLVQDRLYVSDFDAEVKKLATGTADKKDKKGA